MIFWQIIAFESVYKGLYQWRSRFLLIVVLRTVCSEIFMGYLIVLPCTGQLSTLEANVRY